MEGSLTRSFRVAHLGVYFYTYPTPLRPYVTYTYRGRYVKRYPYGHLVPQIGGRMTPSSILFKEVF